MRKQLLSLPPLFMLCLSWIIPSHVLNINTWNIKIGNNVILATHKQSKYGDTVWLDRQILNSPDTLFVERHLCGYFGVDGISTIMLKNKAGKTIKQSTSSDRGFRAHIPLREIKDLEQLSYGETLDLYFSILNKEENINDILLLARLKLK